MAKAGRRGSQTSERIEAFAEDLGRLLGTARAKADSWISQREQITKQLADIRDTASKLLTDLGHQAQSAVRRGAGSKTSYAPAPVSRRRRRKMSAAARAKIAEAQRQRWARQKAAAAKREKK
jgi:ABC-type transporter Mla subunit MlaD